MGNDLCKPATQSDFKLRCNQICYKPQDTNQNQIKHIQNNKYNLQLKIQQHIKSNNKIEPITWSQNNTPRSNQYYDNQNDQIDSFNKHSQINSQENNQKNSNKNNQKNCNKGRNYKINKFKVTDQSISKDKILQKQQDYTFSNLKVNKKYKLNQRLIQTSQSRSQSGSPSKIMKLNIGTLYVKNVKNNTQQGNLNYKPIEVPFNIIKMTLNKKLISLIQQDHQNFFKNHFQFKLFKQGFYGAQLDQVQNFGIFLNTDYFYEGNYQKQLIDGDKNKIGKVIPHGKGIYIDEKGKYKGNFINGKPHGNGKYYQFNNNLDSFNYDQMTETSFYTSRENFISKFNKKQTPEKSSFSRQFTIPSIFNNSKSKNMTVYQGQFQFGQLIKGSIQNQIFKFQGNLRNKKPHGQGKLVVKQHQIVYKGSFKNGLFHDQNAIYQNIQYIYQGSFYEGQKDGFGILQIKDLQKVKNRANVRIGQRYEGQWKNDRFVKFKTSTTKG